MAGKGGARPGAGRKQGGVNKATLEAQLAAAEAQLVRLTQEREAEQAGNGRKSAIAVLDDIMHASYGLMAQHQPLAHNEQAQPGRDPNEEKFRYFLEQTKDAAGKLANFQSPKFKSVVLGVDPSLAAAAGAPGALPPSDPAAVPGAMQQLSPSQAYRLMRDNDVIDLTPQGPKVVQGPQQPAKKAKSA